MESSAQVEDATASLSLDLDHAQGDARQGFWGGEQSEQATPENDEISPRRINTAGKRYRNYILENKYCKSEVNLVEIV